MVLHREVNQLGSVSGEGTAQQSNMSFGFLLYLQRNLPQFLYTKTKTLKYLVTYPSRCIMYVTFCRSGCLS